MFTLTETPVAFIGLLVLFGCSTLWTLWQLALPQNGPALVSNLAHLAMSVVMLLMVPQAVWQPFSAVIPLPGLVGFFGVFALWFVLWGVRGLRGDSLTRKHGWHALGHAGMFGAMTWHLAAMLGHGGQLAEHAHAGHAGASDVALLFALVGVPFMIYLLAAALGNLRWVIMPGRGSRLAALADFAMHVGMFWMSADVMVALVPAFGYLAF